MRRTTTLRALAIATTLALLAACTATDVPPAPASPLDTEQQALFMSRKPVSSEPFVAVGDQGHTIRDSRRATLLVAPPAGYVDAIVNGGFETGFTGWTRTAQGYGYNSNLAAAWIAGASDGNFYYGGMPHSEPLANSGSAGASAIENGSTLHRLYQDVSIFNDGTSRPVTFSFYLRWKNQSGSWNRYDPTCASPGSCQDIVVQVRDPVTNALISELWSAFTTGAPLFSGGGSFATANYQAFSFNLSAYKGMSVRLQFENRVCCYFQYLDIDDVQLIVPVNRPPTANAGADQTVEATSAAGASVTLDGTGSSDPDGDALAYTWREGATVIATGASPSVTLGLGVHTIELTVEDPSGATSTDQVVVTVEDTTAPAITVTASIPSLWPPNHTMQVAASGIGASDIVDGSPTMTIAVTSNEPVDGLGDGDTAPDWTVTRAADGSYTVAVRAERSGKGAGRVYTIVITATDASNNSSSQTLTVNVPRSQGK